MVGHNSKRQNAVRERERENTPDPSPALLPFVLIDDMEPSCAHILVVRSACVDVS